MEKKKGQKFFGILYLRNGMTRRLSFPNKRPRDTKPVTFNRPILL